MRTNLVGAGMLTQLCDENLYPVAQQIVAIAFLEQRSIAWDGFEPLLSKSMQLVMANLKEWPSELAREICWEVLLKC